MGLFSNKSEKRKDWIDLDNLNQLDDICKASHTKVQLIFKHSTRCVISTSALQELNKNLAVDNSQYDFYYLDLIQNRTISNAIPEKFGVEHQSPQLIVVKNGEVVYHESHSSIKVDKALRHINS